MLHDQRQEVSNVFFNEGTVAENSIKHSYSSGHVTLQTRSEVNIIWFEEQCFVVHQ